MIIRNDFVTNSSSSSFVIALEDEITEEQKQILLDYAIKEFLGEIILSPKSTEEEIDKFFEDDYCLFDFSEEEIRKALKQGKTVYGGDVCFEPGAQKQTYFDCWEKLKNAKGVELIETSLVY